MKTLLSIISLLFITTFTMGQSINTESNTHASSLREMYGKNQEGEENSLDMVLSLYYDIKYSYIYQDPHLKQKLINEFIEDVKEKGYKVPKKVKVKNYFEPYEFILDLEVHLDKRGNIIPYGKELTSSIN